MYVTKFIEIVVYVRQPRARVCVKSAFYAETNWK